MKIETPVKPMQIKVIVCDGCGHGAYKPSGKYSVTTGPLIKIADGVYRHDGCGKRGGRIVS